MDTLLTVLTSSKVKFNWTTAADKVVIDLKKRFTSAPILCRPDPSRQFIVEVDASDKGVGAILSQRYSHKLSSMEGNYNFGDRELLAGGSERDIFSLD